MKNRLCLLVALLFVICLRLPPAGAAPDFEAARLSAVSANPPGVSLTLSLPPGRTQFHQGEVIPLTATFSSRLPKAYRLNAGPGLSGSGDRELPWNSDAFQVDDTTGAVDPLAAYYAHEFGTFYSGGGPQFQDLTAQPASIPYALNEWLRFDAPGRYRVYLTSGRIVDVGRNRPGIFPFQGRATTSNAVDLEILPRDPALDAQTLQQALPLLNEEGFHASTQIARQAAVRAIRFLGTPEAARAMVARYGYPTDYEQGNYFSYRQTRLGLFGFPQPSLVTQEMERGLADPDFCVFNDFLYDLAQAQFFSAFPQPLSPYPAADPLKVHQWYTLRAHLSTILTTLEEQNWQTLAATADAKRGKARAVSLFTVLQLDSAHRDAAGHEDTAGHQQRMRALLPLFDDLTPEEQNSLLDYNDWPQVHSPDLLPLLRRIFAGPPPKVESVNWQDYDVYRRNDLVLRDLTQLFPTEGRLLLLAEVRNPTPRVDLPTLCSLPDRTLPALDGILATNLANSLQSPRGYRETVARLVERYATGAVLPRIKAAYEGSEGEIGGPLLFDFVAYFLRTDRSYGVRQVEKALADRQGSGWYRSALSDVAALFPCPEVERLAVTHLHDSDPEVVVDAVKTLGAYGSPAAEASLWARMREWHRQEVGKAELSTPASAELEYAFTDALATAPGWLADRAKLREMEDLCVTPNGRANVAASFRQWQEPVSITFMREQGQWSVAQYGQLSSLAALESKLAQFPRGTRFRLAHWNFPGRAEQAQAFGRLKPFLEKRGMRLEEEPFPPH